MRRDHSGKVSLRDCSPSPATSSRPNSSALLFDRADHAGQLVSQGAGPTGGWAAGIHCGVLCSVGIGREQRDERWVIPDAL